MNPIPIYLNKKQITYIKRKQQKKLLKETTKYQHALISGIKPEKKPIDKINRKLKILFNKYHPIEVMYGKKKLGLPFFGKDKS